MTTSTWRLAFRLAGRESRRRPGRTLLVALLVALPVAGMVAAATMIRTDNEWPSGRWEYRNGQADAAVRGVDPAEVELPAGAEAVAITEAPYRPILTADRELVNAWVTDVPLGHPLTEGIYTLTAGRAPAARGEIVVSPTLAGELELEVGDELALERPARARYAVVGIAERNNYLAEPSLILASGAASELLASAEVATSTLVGLPAGLDRLPVEAGTTVYRDQDPWTQSEDPASGDVAIRWNLVGGALALVVMGIVIASAFASGARRQMQTLGQLGANGADRAAMRRMLLLQGTWAGAVGALLGLLLGGAALLALHPFVDRIFGRRVGGYAVGLADLMMIVLLAVVAATLAAVVPARSAAKVSILAALAGRRPAGRVPRWLWPTGLASFGAGVALLGVAVVGARGDGSTVWLVVAIVGGLGVLLGACGVAPTYVSWLGPSSARLRGSWKVATRSLGRQRTRTAAVVSGVAVATALAVGVGAGVASAEANRDTSPWMRDDRVVIHNPATYASTAPDVAPESIPGGLVRQVAQAVPDAERIDVMIAHRDGGLSAELSDGSGSGPFFAVVDRAQVADLYGLDPDARAALEASGILVFAYPEDGAVPTTASIIVRTADRVVGIDGPVLDARQHGIGGLPSVLVTLETARDLDLAVTDGPVVFDNPAPLEEDQRAALRAATAFYEFDAAEAALDPRPDRASFTEPVRVDVFEEPDDAGSQLLVESVLAAIAALFALFVVFASLALAAAESRDERDTLAVVGAAPETLRRIAGQKALVLAGLGVGLGLPAGIIPAFVAIKASEFPPPFTLPWITLAAVGFGIPLLAGALGTVGSSVAHRFRPARMSTMAFD